MATRLYSTALGADYVAVTEAVGSATVTASVELTVDFAVVTNKRDVLEAIKRIERAITVGVWPPA